MTEILSAHHSLILISKTVLSIVHLGPPNLTKPRIEADSDIVPSLGMGTVYVSVASSPFTSSTYSRVTE